MNIISHSDQVVIYSTKKNSIISLLICVLVIRSITMNLFSLLHIYED